MNPTTDPVPPMTARVILTLVLWMVLRIQASLPLFAQPVFTSQDLPSTPGQWYRAYVDTSGVDVATWVRPKGGPHRWDFSSPRVVPERIERVDIVPASDGGHGGSFPGATYAERLSRESSPIQSWSFYALAPGRGRLYFGFHDAVSKPANPVTAFRESTLDIPDLGPGSSWERAVTFEDSIDAGIAVVPVLIEFTSRATVDAWGSVVLPGLGEMPAWRVNEVNTYVATDTSLGFPLGKYYVRNYFWLVKGIGKAVHMISKSSSAVPPEDFGPSAYVHRVFESSAIPSVPTFTPATGLSAARKGDEIFLSWDRGTSNTTYVVQVAPGLNSGESWSGLVTNRDTFLFDPIPRGAGQRFYRVFEVSGSAAP